MASAVAHVRFERAPAPATPPHPRAAFLKRRARTSISLQVDVAAEVTASMLKNGSPAMPARKSTRSDRHSALRRSRSLFRLTDLSDSPCTPETAPMSPSTTTTPSSPAEVELLSPRSAAAANKLSPKEEDLLQLATLRREAALLSEPLSTRFSMHKVLRQSLFGNVVAGTCRGTNEQVAVKLSNIPLVLEGVTIKGSRVTENPMREARMMRHLQADGASHPNVIRLLHEAAEQNVHMMVLEYAPNGEFFDFVMKQQQLSNNTAKFYFRQIASALKFLHDRNVCHLDLSMENLLMDREFNVKLTDFGVARQVRPHGAKFPGMKGHKPGKLRYMAPELLQGQDFDGRAADMFSLGVTLFSMITGFAPFETPSPADPRFVMIMQGQMAEMLDILALRDRVSDDALDLLKGLIAPAEKRLTIDAVFKHPYLL